ncbi:hypothetical protein Tco_0514488 [Tanacetum coccineum]
MSALKLPALKTRDYNLWSMRMEQYLTHIDYALWEVIVNGDAPVVASASAEGPIPLKTVEQKLARKNELKAKSTLLLAIPDEHLLKFHGIKDAKTVTPLFLHIAAEANLGVFTNERFPESKIQHLNDNGFSIFVSSSLRAISYLR